MYNYNKSPFQLNENMFISQYILYVSLFVFDYNGNVHVYVL